jgi:hypothetical protein
VPGRSLKGLFSLGEGSFLPGSQFKFLYHPSEILFLPGTFFFFLVECCLTQGFALAKQALYSLSHISGPFCSSYFVLFFSHFICFGYFGDGLWLLHSHKQGQ